MADLMTNPKSLQIERERIAASMLQEARRAEFEAPRTRAYTNATKAQTLRDWAAKLIANDFQEEEAL